LDINKEWVGWEDYPIEGMTLWISSEGDRVIVDSKRR